MTLLVLLLLSFFSLLRQGVTICKSSLICGANFLRHFDKKRKKCLYKTAFLTFLEILKV